MYLSAIRCNHFIHRWHFFRSSYLYFIKTNQCVIPTTKLFYSLWSYNAYSPNFWLNHFKNVRSTSVYVCVCVLFAQSCPIFCDPMDCNLWASLSMKFSRQEYWSGLPFSSPWDLPDSGIKPTSLACRSSTTHQQKHLKRTLFLLSFLVKLKVKSLGRVGFFATPWTVAHQDPLSMELSR